MAELFPCHFWVQAWSERHHCAARFHASASLQHSIVIIKPIMACLSSTYRRLFRSLLDCTWAKFARSLGTVHSVSSKHSTVTRDRAFCQLQVPQRVCIRHQAFICLTPGLHMPDSRPSYALSDTFHCVASRVPLQCLELGFVC
jgi:hypothetical protein